MAAVRMATGDMTESQDIDEESSEYFGYVEYGSVQYHEGQGRKEPLPISFNYERWLNSHTIV